MHRNVRLALVHGGPVLVAVVISVVVTLFLVTKYYYQPIVVVDLDEISGHVQKKAMTLDKEQAVEYIGEYYDWMAKGIKERTEVVLVKKAVINVEHVKDITNEYKK